MTKPTCDKCGRGRPCDICDGTWWSYLGEPCRHCNPKSPYFNGREREDEQ